MSTTAAVKAGKSKQADPESPALPDFRYVTVKGEPVGVMADLLGHAATDPDARETVAGILATASVKTDAEISLVIAGARHLDASNTIGQAIACAIVSAAGRGAATEYGQQLGLTTGAVSKRNLMGQLALADAIAPTITPPMLSSALSQGTTAFRKILDGGQSPRTLRKRVADQVSANLARKAEQEAARKAEQDTARTSTTTDKADDGPEQGDTGRPDTTARVTSALALLDARMLGAMTDAELAAVSRAIDAARGRVDKAEAKRTTVAA